MDKQHPFIELYLTLNDEQASAVLEGQLANLDLDQVVKETLRATNIEETVMLTLLITDDAGIQEMNQQYRDQAKPTDVLSFPLLDAPIVDAPEVQLWTPPESDPQSPTDPATGPLFVSPPGSIMNLGDIVMSWPTVQRQALEAGHSSMYELLFLLAHGVLHLIGYDDQTEEGYQAMLQLQNQILATLGISR